MHLGGVSNYGVFHFNGVSFTALVQVNSRRFGGYIRYLRRVCTFFRLEFVSSGIVFLVHFEAQGYNHLYMIKKLVMSLLKEKCMTRKENRRMSWNGKAIEYMG